MAERSAVLLRLKNAIKEVTIANGINNKLKVREQRRSADQMINVTTTANLFQDHKVKHAELIHNVKEKFLDYLLCATQELRQPLLIVFAALADAFNSALRKAALLLEMFNKFALPIYLSAFLRRVNLQPKLALVNHRHNKLLAP
jgi:hypothetical protein